MLTGVICVTAESVTDCDDDARARGREGLGEEAKADGLEARAVCSTESVHARVRAVANRQAPAQAVRASEWGD